MKRYWNKAGAAGPEEGAVVSAGERVDVLGKEGLRGVRCVLPWGMEAFPAEGDNVVLLPLETGERVALGTACFKGGEEGAVKLQAKGGAYILLHPNGTVEINGLVVQPDGSFGQKEGS